MPDPATVLTGGCQCGTVRYAMRAEPAEADICHCRMCQKALGGPFLAAASVPLAAFAWTRATPATYRSSSVAERAFCPQCGTPLSFRYLEGDTIAITIGSLDEAARVRPTRQYGMESRLPWLEEALAAPGARTEDEPPPGGMAAIRSHQHPDREPAD